MLPIQHSNIEAEQSILGLLIMHNEALQKVSDILKVDHFYSESHQKIYDEILKKINLEKGIADLITLRPFFGTLPEGKDYLGQLVNVSSIMPIRDYAFSLVELSEKRKLLAGFHEMIVLLESKNSADVVAKAQDLIASIEPPPLMYSIALLYSIVFWFNHFFSSSTPLATFASSSTACKPRSEASV